MPDKQTSLKLACIVIVLFAAGFLLPKFISSIRQGTLFGPPQSSNEKAPLIPDALSVFMDQAKAEFDVQSNGLNDKKVFEEFNFKYLQPNFNGNFKPLRGWPTYLDKSPKLIPTIANRVKGAATDETDLIIVLAGVNNEACKASGLESQGSIDMTPYPDLPSQPAKTELPGDKGCIKTPNGNYFYKLLRAR